MKKKFLIFGVSGMLGHNLFTNFCLQKKFEVFGTCRNYRKKKIFNNFEKKKIFFLQSIFESKKIEMLIKKTQPDIVINCIGVIKQSKKIQNLSEATYINSVFPHLLSSYAYLYKFKLIHFSTDCVFDGKRGSYTEKHTPNSIDFYGVSKTLGELDNKFSITIRTSIVGREKFNKKSLFEWFLKQNKSVKGYSKAIFSGLPTQEISNFLIDLIKNDKLQKLSGILNLASKPINKYELLNLFKTKLSKKIIIYKNSTVRINRSLNPDKLKKLIKYKPKNWKELINII